MASVADLLTDRHRLKRQLTIARLAAAIAVAACAVLVFAEFGGWRMGQHVARIDLSGVLSSDPRRDEAIDRILKDQSARALIVVIDSPGGTVVAAETIYSQLRTASARMPVVAVMQDVATSAAYYAALGSDRIFARAGTVTGSIGVILQTADVTPLLERIGIKPEIIKSSDLKAQPNPFEPLTSAGREATKAVVLDIYKSFMAVVAERRELSAGQAAEVADGRIFTGRQALAAGLIDQLGGETEARAWLSEAKGVDIRLPVKRITSEGLDERITGTVGRAVRTLLTSDPVQLDGLSAIWHATAAVE